MRPAAPAAVAPGTAGTPALAAAMACASDAATTAADAAPDPALAAPAAAGPQTEDETLRQLQREANGLRSRVGAAAVCAVPAAVSAPMSVPPGWARTNGGGAVASGGVVAAGRQQQGKRGPGQKRPAAAARAAPVALPAPVVGKSSKSARGSRLWLRRRPPYRRAPRRAPHLRSRPPAQQPRGASRRSATAARSISAPAWLTDQLSSPPRRLRPPPPARPALALRYYSLPLPRTEQHPFPADGGHQQPPPLAG